MISKCMAVKLRVKRNLNPQDHHTCHAAPAKEKKKGASTVPGHSQAPAPSRTRVRAWQTHISCDGIWEVFNNSVLKKKNRSYENRQNGVYFEGRTQGNCGTMVTICLRKRRHVLRKAHGLV
jgi:hypothetical protein